MDNKNRIVRWLRDKVPDLYIETCTIEKASAQYKANKANKGESHTFEWPYRSRERGRIVNSAQPVINP